MQKRLKCNNSRKSTASAMIMQHLLHFLFSAPLSHPSLTPPAPIHPSSLTRLSPIPHPSITLLSPIPHPSLYPPTPLSHSYPPPFVPFLILTFSLVFSIYHWDIIGLLLGYYWVIIGLLSNSHRYHTVLTLRLRSDDTPPRTKFYISFFNFLQNVISLRGQISKNNTAPDICSTRETHKDRQDAVEVSK